MDGAGPGNGHGRGMSQELFRREALEARRGSWLGAISLAQPLRLWLLTAAAAAVALAVILFLLFGTYTRRSPVVDRKSTRLNSSHVKISYAVFCLKKKIELNRHYIWVSIM